MLDNVYNTKIIEYAGNIARIGRLEDRHATAKAHSKLCGSTVIVDLKIEEGMVTDFAHEVKACALGQASSAIMAKTIIGASINELKALKKTMYAMLKDGGTPPAGRFEEFKFLQPICDYKARHASTLLTFDAVVDCIEQIEAQEISHTTTQKQARSLQQHKAGKAAANALNASGIKFRMK